MSETKLYTAEEFIEWAEPRAARYELIAGLPRKLMWNHWDHGVTAARIMHA